jgi:excinuclease ABC subunit A
MKSIVIKGAREHNLKNVDLELPRDRLIVISGISGSGKSSLAFDTIFAEGQRRYVESLSAYARQFLGRLDKPDVDYIEGLSPAISIEQKTTHRNPRSTVGTVTEIYDYLRLLYARIGVPHCPQCGREIHEQSLDQIVDAVMGKPEGTRIALLAPAVRGKKGEHQKVLEDARRAGFVRVRVNGEIHSLDEEIRLDRQKKHSIEVVVDRLVIRPQVAKRLAGSVETALEVGGGQLVVLVQEKGAEKEEFYSQMYACPLHGVSIPDLQPRLFSFNSPFGACPACSGLGVTLEFDPDLVIPNRRLSFNQGAIVPYNPKANWYRSIFKSLAHHFGFTLDTPLDELPAPVLSALLHGTEEKIEFSYVNREQTGRWEYSSGYRGVLNDLRRRYLESSSGGVKEWLEEFMSQKECTECGGRRLRPEALGVTVGGKNIYEATTLTVRAALPFFRDLALSPTEEAIARQILKEIRSRLSFMLSVGLDYLTLERRASTLSGGEAQRIRLATQIGSSLVGVLYILDEPTIGLHQRDNQRLLDTLKSLRDQGNTLIVVEHDEQTLRSADYIVDLGPAAGVHGGEVIFAGTYPQILEDERSLTGRYLSGRLAIPGRDGRREGNGRFITLYGAAEHNLKGIDVRIPLGRLTAITGVSGSGKSTLLTDLLFPALYNRLGGGTPSAVEPNGADAPAEAEESGGGRSHAEAGGFCQAEPRSGSAGRRRAAEDTEVGGGRRRRGSARRGGEETAAAAARRARVRLPEGKHAGIEGVELVDKVINIDQSPIGRTPRSNPATYVGLFAPIRTLFSSLPESRARGYKAGRFSFNVKGGRCENCQGAGTIRIAMHFLPDVYITCDVCGGRRYNRETLDVRYKGKNIHEVLAMTVEEALGFFDKIPAITQKLATLQAVGLEYIQLGQSALTLSGGEAQRVKLALELSRRSTGRTFYILDEPTTGLHFADVRKLMEVLNLLVDQGNTVVLIEHNLDVIKQADHIIDLGPEGGDRGGEVVGTGTPEQLMRNEKSYTGAYLKQALGKAAVGS